MVVQRRSGRDIDGNSVCVRLDRYLEGVGMTQDEVIAMAKQAGLLQDWMVPYEGEIDGLQRFWELATAKEREACAQLVQDKQELDPYAGVNGWVLADAIRARGNA